MSNRIVWTAFGPALAAALLLLPGAAHAFSKHYAIPFSCGNVDPNDPSFGAVPGEYATAISVLNGQNRVVGLEAEVVLTNPSGLSSDTIRTRIQPGAARMIDCSDILGGIFNYPSPFPVPTPTYYTGFVSVKSQNELAVSAHYTASGGGEVSSQMAQIEGQNTFFFMRRDHKVEICHVPPGNPGNAHEIEVDQSSVPAHLSHGDYKGRCN